MSRRLPLLGLLPFALWGCAAASASAGDARGAAIGTYRGEVADQFDDAIESHAVGLELDTYGDPMTDKKLRDRAQAADVVVRARVTTVTGETESGNKTYQVSFHAIERLAGNHPIGDDFTLRIDKDSPSLGIVTSLEGQLVGKSFDLFVKAFARSDGDRDLHFHATVDSPQTKAAIKAAVILDEVK